MLTIPLNMSLVTVYGRFIRLDGTPMIGTVSFSPSVSVILNRNADVIISGAVFTATLDAAGYFEIDIPATDDEDLDPVNFTYGVQEPSGRSYNMSLPQNVANRRIDLIDVAPSSPSRGQTSILLRGIGIASMTVTDIGDLIVTYDNGNTVNVGNSRGPQGFTGPQGVAGPIGPLGPVGPQGAVGPLGPVGPQGVQGVQGNVGPVGPAGLTWRGTWSASTDYVKNDAVALGGASYFAYVDPPVASDPSTDTARWAPLSLRGAQGVQGVQGVAGPTGPSGPKGDTGSTGPAGPQGVVGPAGPAGPSGPIRTSADYDDTVAPTPDQVISWNGSKFAPRTVVDGVNNHGSLLGLSSDDHPQYLNSARGDARYYTQTQQDSLLNAKANTTDPRFTDSRVPTAHKASHAAGGSDVLVPSDIGAVPTSRTVGPGTGLSGGGDLSANRTLSVVYGSASGSAVQGNDVRVTADQAVGTASIRTLGTGSLQAVAGNDARLSDARTPTSHAASHASGGSDAVTPAAIGALATSARGAASGVASLDSSTKILYAQVPIGTAVATVAAGNDSRFTDARTPVSHQSSHAPGGSDALSGYADLTTTQTIAGAKTFSTSPVVPVGTLTTHPVRRDDSRLTDSRTPTAHQSTHAPGGSDALSGYADLTTAQTIAGVKTFSSSPLIPAPSGSASAVRNDDVRLSDTRVPTAHAATHATNGSDPVTPAAIGAATSAHTHATSVVPLAPVTLTDASTIATNASQGTHFRCTIGASRTLGSPSNPTDGQRAVWEITASGAYALTLTTGSQDAFELSDAVSTATINIASGKTILLGALYSVARRRWSVMGDAVTV